MDLSNKVLFFNRETKSIEAEAIFGEKPLRWVYETLLGKVSLFVLIRRALFSNLYGKIMSKENSKARVAEFIKNFHIDTSEFLEPADSYASFNDFFSRKLKLSARPIVSDENIAVLPADGRHLGYEIISGEKNIYAKGQSFNLEELLQDKELAKRYQNGSIICSRLCPTDYHRFHFPVAGVAKSPKLINGYLYSVNPIALSKKIAYLWENKRVLIEIDSPRFGKVIQVLIGATNVGTIKTTYSENIFLNKGDELGYFRFGGSFVATLFEPNKIKLAEDLLDNSLNGRETYAKMGTELGHLK